MQKLLFIVAELHERGFEKLRIVPSLSPSGMSWRCQFFVVDKSNNLEVIASNWIYQLFDKDNSEIKLSIGELTNLFITQYSDFVERCRGENKIYVVWFSKMLQILIVEELPYAFGEYFSPTDFWKTSLGNEIKIIPGEEFFYIRK